MDYKKSIISVYLVLIVLTINAQVNMFNKWFLPNGTNPSGGLDIVENDAGYVIIGFAPLAKIVVSFIDSMGNFQYSKVYEHADFFYHPERANNLNLLSIGNGSLYGIMGESFDSVQTYYSTGIVKFDNNFDTVFTKRFFVDTFYSSCAQSLGDDFGNYVFAGYNRINSTSWDAVLFSVDTIGNLLWEKRYGGGGDEQTYLLLNAFNGGYLIGGKSNSFGINSPYDNGEWYIIKTDSIGNFEWHRHYGNSSFDDGNIMSMCYTNDSCYFLAGAYTVEKYGAYTNIMKSRLVKINQTGNIVWDKLFGYKGRENSIFKVFQLDNGDIITLSNNDSLSQYCSSINSIVHCLDYEGNVKWRRKYNFINDTCSFWSQASLFKKTKDAGYLFAGMGYNVNMTPRQYTWVFKTDSLGFDGTFCCDDTTLNVSLITDTVCFSDSVFVKFRITGKSAPYSLSLDNGQNNINIFYPDTYEDFTTDSLFIFPSDYNTWHNYTATLTDAWGNHITKDFSVYIKNCGIGDVESNDFNEKIKIYPNPANDILNIELPNYSENTLFVIIDSKGQNVLSKLINPANSQINVKVLQNGIYLVKIFNNNFFLKTKLVINRAI